jgi:hypothetical protein
MPLPSNPEPTAAFAASTSQASFVTFAAAGGGPAPAPPQVPGYEILGELGRGGMGVVYQARHLALNRTVALKMLLHAGHAGSQQLKRFRTEAEAIARLQHPHIVQVYEIGEHDGCPFLSLEYCDGGTLEHQLRGTPMPARDAAQLVETLARAVQAAHAKGVVHRDLKPANVLLTGRPPPAVIGLAPGDKAGAAPARLGEPKVADFGLAKKLDGEPGASAHGLTQTGAVLGTPSYMAPEQAGGDTRAVGPTTDVYALGAILYECLTGRPPFKAATALDTIFQVKHADPVPPAQLQPGVPRDLETICLTCLHKQPSRRFAGAAALADDLQRFLRGEPVKARPVGQIERTIKWVRRRPAVAALLGLVLAVTVAGLAGIAWAYGLAREERDKLATQVEKAVKAEKKATAERDAARAEAEQQRQRAEAQPGTARPAPPALTADAAGAVVAVLAGPRQVEIWDAASGQKRDAFEQPADVRTLLAAPNGHLLFLALADGSVHVRELATGKQRVVLAGENTDVHRLALAPDGKRLAVVQAFAVQVVMLPEGTKLATLPGTFADACFGADGTRLLLRPTAGGMRTWELPVQSVDR